METQTIVSREMGFYARNCRFSEIFVPLEFFGKQSVLQVEIQRLKKQSGFQRGSV